MYHLKYLQYHLFRKYMHNKSKWWKFRCSVSMVFQPLFESLPQSQDECQYQCYHIGTCKSTHTYCIFEWLVYWTVWWYSWIQTMHLTYGLSAGFWHRCVNWPMSLGPDFCMICTFPWCSTVLRNFAWYKFYKW